MIDPCVTASPEDRSVQDLIVIHARRLGYVVRQASAGHETTTCVFMCEHPLPGHPPTGGIIIYDTGNREKRSDARA